MNLLMRAAALAGAAVLAGTAALAGGSAGVASAATGATIATVEQAGYAATGAQFQNVQTTVYLRNPAQYSEIGSYGLSVQLWSASRLLVLGVSDTTTSSPFSPAVAVFNPATRALMCSTAGSGSQQCPGTPANWANGSVSYKAGHTVTLRAAYNKTLGTVHFVVRDVTAGTSSGFTYDVGTGVSFNQARVGTEFGATPWSAPSYKAPGAAAKLAAFTGSQLTSYSGHHASFESWWTARAVVMTGPGSVIEAAPTALANSGANFNVYLQP
ncbi:MAG TPA: hypothetical protein VMV92_25915 [Streptosporangiaceae bacterium]|nr:hypothetical protein [Streptosporangiaceae bacterium]